MKTLKNIIILLFIIFFNIWIQNVNANVDQTNAFTFKYDCIDWEWILKADFNLWWHHHYYRQYKINKPWIVEISDTKHTTISKTTGISIDWCNYQPTTCDIDNEWNWEYLEGKDENEITLNIERNERNLIDLNAIILKIHPLF